MLPKNLSEIKRTVCTYISRLVEETRVDESSEEDFVDQDNSPPIIKDWNEEIRSAIGEIIRKKVNLDHKSKSRLHAK